MKLWWGDSEFCRNTYVQQTLLTFPPPPFTFPHFSPREVPGSGHTRFACVGWLYMYLVWFSPPWVVSMDPLNPLYLPVFHIPILLCAIRYRPMSIIWQNIESPTTGTWRTITPWLHAGNTRYATFPIHVPVFSFFGSLSRIAKLCLQTFLLFCCFGSTAVRSSFVHCCVYSSTHLRCLNNACMKYARG